MDDHRPEASRSWLPFAERLAEVLSIMEEDQFLILNAKNSNRFVQFAAQGSYGMRVEVVSNAFLEGDDRHSDEDLLMLRGFGWADPTSRPGLTPAQDPDGSPNHFREWETPVNFGEVAMTSVRTFIEVLGVAAPGWLEYRAFDSESCEILLPTLGLRRPSKV